MSTAELPAPVADPAAVTPEWLTGALGGPARVTTVRAERIGTGLVGQSVRFHLTWDTPGAGPATVVGKFPSPDPKSRERGRAGGEYRREVRFYQRLAAGAGLRLPGCRLASYDEATGDFTLLLDDLAPARQGDQLAGCTPDEAAAVLAEAARLHAAYWADPRLDAEDWLRRPHPEREATGALLTRLWPGFQAEYGPDLPAGGAELGARFVETLPVWAERDTAPRCLAHGDLRVDNVLFGAGRPVVVDWQTVGQASAASDVAYLLGASLTVADRRAHEDALLAGYHRALTAHGVQDYPLARLREDHRRAALCGVGMTIGASMLVGVDDRGRRMFATMAERHLTHALDLGAEEYLG
ncbi:aminoglycoside phosphotransferase family protein [Pseudonocardia halophobica]|uniref:phosphotransferase family protein n=1 Tax=Pseudonocardia halophobica TaxID=29401 RepID=UPI003D942589